MKKLKDLPQLLSYLVWEVRAMGRLEKLWQSKKYEEVISFCNVMITKNPTNFFAFYYRGISNEELTLFDESIEDLKKSEDALRKNKLKSFERWYFKRIPIHLSRVYRKLQDRVKTFEYADKAVQIDSEGIDGLKWRASLKEDFGDYIGASDDLNEALKRRPKDKSLMKSRDRMTYMIIVDKKEASR